MLSLYSTMDVSDDEDVVLENSPLYDYLKEACPTEDFLTCQTTTTHEQFQDRDATKQGIGEDQESGWFSRLNQYRQFDSQIVAEAYLPQYMSVVLHSQSMFAEDMQVILMYSNEKVPGGDNPQDMAMDSTTVTGSGEQPFMQILSTFGLFATLVGLCIGGYRSVSSDMIITPFQIFTWLTLLVLCLVNSILYGSTWWVNNLLHKQHKDNVKMLDSMVSLHDKYGSLLRKCIRYVQEIEVISRGFTLATPFTPASQLDGLDNFLAEQQCPLLREVCFHTCKQQIFSLKEATVNLLQQTKLEPEVDSTTSYLAKMDLDKIIPSPLHKDANCDDLEVAISPTTRTLAVLKVMYDLYIELKSEFLRRLLLCLCPDAIHGNEKLDAASLDRWRAILSGIQGSSKKTLTKLEHSYEWHKERPTSRRQGRDDTQYKSLEVKWSPAKHLVTAVHSLRLQLDLALNGAITAEEHLSNLADDITQNQDEMEKTYKILETLLEGANEKLQSSHSCFQQASMALTKLQGKEPKQQTTGEVKMDPTAAGDPNTELPMATLVMPVAPEDMDFEDMVYEADMNAEDHERTDEDFDSDWLLEEKVRRKQEAEETKHLLQELHTVLGQRSKDREIRQLARKCVSQSPTDGAHDAGVEESTAESSDDKVKVSELGAHLSSESNRTPDDEQRTNRCDPSTSEIDDAVSSSEEAEMVEPCPPTFGLPPPTGLPHNPIGLPRPPIGLPFMTSVAVEAVMKSKLRGALSEETFGQGDDSGSSDEDQED